MLDGVGPASRGVVGVEPELLSSAALAKQVPAAVELYLHRPQPFPICLEGIGVRAVVLLAATEVLLLRHEPFDSGGNALVALGRILEVITNATSST